MSGEQAIVELAFIQLEAEDRRKEEAIEKQDVETQFSAEKIIAQRTILQTQILNVRYAMSRASEEVARLSQLKSKLPRVMRRGMDTLVALKKRNIGELRHKLKVLLSRYDVTQAPPAPRRADALKIISGGSDD